MRFPSSSCANVSVVVGIERIHLLKLCCPFLIDDETCNRRRPIGDVETKHRKRFLCRIVGRLKSAVVIVARAVWGETESGLKSLYSTRLQLDQINFDRLGWNRIGDADKLDDRLDRVELFRKYLDSQFSLLASKPIVFDWPTVNVSMISTVGFNLPPNFFLRSLPWLRRQPGTQYFRAYTSIFRNFCLSDRFRLQFLAEAFNVLNHTNFLIADNTSDDPLFGKASSTAPPRNLHFGSN